MKNQVDYFERVIKILKELREDHPDVEICKHLMLATDANINFSDRELYSCLQKHKNELDINTLSDKDLEKVISETEELFQETEEGYDPLEEDDPWHREEENY
jgi:hypothetical protein